MRPAVIGWRRLVIARLNWRAIVGSVVVVIFVLCLVLTTQDRTTRPDHRQTHSAHFVQNNHKYKQLATSFLLYSALKAAYFAQFDHWKSGTWVIFP
jgi:hypothetical protein